MGLKVVTVGSGPRVLFVHGSATDHMTWSVQLSGPLKQRLTLIAYDRRLDATTIAEHADDALALLAEDDRPAIIVGSSMGAVVALEAPRRAPPVIAGGILIEPPMPANDLGPLVADFLGDLDATLASDGPTAAAELFLRTVLGDAAYERMPRMYRQRAAALWPQIRSDCAALIAYRPRYAELGSVRAPVVLLGAGQSAPYFRPTLAALARALPHATLEVIPNAGHMLHVEAHRRFGELLLAFAESRSVM